MLLHMSLPLTGPVSNNSIHVEALDPCNCNRVIQKLRLSVPKRTQ
jgi:hypothetical protein